MSIFEATMMVCFGVSWPMAIWKTFSSKNSTGKSIPFLLLIIVGYIAGCINKLIGNFDWVFYLYVVNTAMVVADLCLTIHYRKAPSCGAKA